MAKVFRSRAGRLAAVATIIVCVSPALAACAHSDKTTTPGGLASSSPAISPNVVTPPPVTPTPTATATAGYPTDYAGAILTAWGSQDWTRLDELTSDAPAIQHISGNLDQHWTKINCDGAMGSNYCSYYNNSGDEIIIQLNNEALAGKQYHAGALQTWDPMTFPTTATPYADKFVNAWIGGNKSRMALLSTDKVTAHFLTITPPDSEYKLAPSGAAGHTYVEITRSGTTLDATIVLNNVTVSGGGQHAIEDCNPTCS